MKRTTVHKKAIFRMAIAFLLAVLAVVFCIPQKRRAQAYDGTFYFRGDPVISATTTDDRYPIRFNLIVSSSAMTSTDEVTVTLSSNSDGAYIQRGHENTTLTETEGTSQSVSFPYSAITFASDGMASLYVDMYISVYEKGRLTATCNGTTSVSDEHTVISAIELAAADGYSAQGGLTSTGAVALAKIYDKYAGKDPTTERGSLSFVSNLYPTYYSSSSTISAEIEMPANVAELLKNNTEYEEDRYNDGLTGTYYDIEANYYTLCLSVTSQDPSSVGFSEVSVLPSVSRRFFYGGKSWSAFMYDVRYPNGSYDEFNSRLYSVMNSWTPSGQLAQVKGSGSYLTGLTSDSTNKLTLNYSILDATFKKVPLYFFVEVLEYSFDVRVSSISSNYTIEEMTTGINAIYRSDVVYTSMHEIAERVLTNNAALGSGERSNVCAWGGIDTTAEKELEVIYKTYSTSGNYETVSSVYNIGVADIYNKHSAIKAMYDLSGISDISAFNIVSVRQTYDAESGMVYNMGEKILRQALDYDYVYDAEAGKAYATVVYDDYLYKDFSIRVKNNEPNNELELDYYTAEIEIADGVVTLIYNYADISERLANACGWLCELTADSFTVTGASDALIAVDIGDEELRVRIPVKYQSDLFGLNITAMAEIVPDEEYSVTYVYYTDFTVSSDGKTITPKQGKIAQGSMLLSKINLYNDYNNFMLQNAATVNAPLNEFEQAYDVAYATPQDVRLSWDSTTKGATITVLYQLQSLIRVTDNLTSDWYYVPTSHSTNVYETETFVDARGGVVEGYRVDALSGDSVFKITNAYDYRNGSVLLYADTYSGDIYTIKIVFTDKWNIVINYMDQYKATPFAAKTQYTGEVRVADYPDIYALTSSDLATILGRSSMGIINNKSTVDTIKIAYDGIGTYKVDTTYSYMSMVKQTYEGEIVEEIKVPLTSYADWCENYGKDWSILYLNYGGKIHFQYSNEVSREDLYGFFSVAIFEEKVTDLNYYFKDYTGTGCITIQESEEVRGSRIYKFFGDLKQSGNIILSVIGHVGMAFCEVVNDENAIYHSFFFYLDGTSATAMLSGSGATDPTDTDSALVNAVQGIGNDISNWWEGLKNKAESSTVWRILAIAIPIVLVVVIVSLVVKFFVWLFKKRE